MQRAGDIEGGDESNEALDEIRSVLWIKGIPDTPQTRCKEALESWKEKEELFTSRIDRKKKQSADFQNEIYQLVGFYSVFQGVLFTAVAQSNLLHCNNTWTATLLSALASFVTVIGVVLKLRSIKELNNTIRDEDFTRRALVNWLLRLKESGKEFNFDDAVVSKHRQGARKTSWWLNVSFLTVTIALILFSVAFLVSIQQILCNPGYSEAP